MAAISFASCGNKAEAPATEGQNDTTEVVDTTADTTSVDTTNAQ